MTGLQNSECGQFIKRQSTFKIISLKMSISILKVNVWNKSQTLNSSLIGRWQLKKNYRIFHFSMHDVSVGSLFRKLGIIKFKVQKIS